MIDLVNDGKDVPVFTVVDGKLVSRMMRNPRKTGTNVPVYRVKFSDGTEITTTLNHKFTMKDGSVKTVSDLQPNDSIDSLKVYSYKKAGLPNAMKVSYDQDHKSYRMMQYGQYRKSEHRLIYQNFDNDPIDGIDEHIHHEDFDARNNALFNLERMTSKEHASLHRDRMLGLNNPVHNMNDEWRKNLSIAGSGDKNPNYSGITNEDLEIKIQQYIKSLGYIPSTNEYQKDAKSFGWPV